MLLLDQNLMNKHVTIMSVFKYNCLPKNPESVQTKQSPSFSHFFQGRKPPKRDGKILLHGQDQTVFPHYLN